MRRTREELKMKEGSEGRRKEEEKEECVIKC